MAKSIQENKKANREIRANESEDRLLTIREVADITGLAVGSLYHLACQGRIPTTRLSKRCLRFRRSALIRWWDERSSYPSDPNEEADKKEGAKSR